MYSDNVVHVDFIKPVRLTSNEKVLLRDIWQQLKVQKHFTQSANQNLDLFKENEDFGSFNLKVKRETETTVLKEYWVTVDTAKEICMLSRTEEGRRVRRYFIECERLVYDHGLDTGLTIVPGVLNSDFLQAVADNFKRLEDERDEAIRTKTYISDRKTATAMNTSSQAVKSRNRVLQLVKEKDETIDDLSQRMGESEEWSTAAVAIARHPELATIGQNRLGKLLAKRSRELGVEIRKAASERYPNGIGIYHKTVVDDVARCAG